MMKIRDITFYSDLQKKLEKKCKKQYRKEGPQKFIEMIVVIEEIQITRILGENRWKDLHNNIYEIMPFGHKAPERLFCYKKTGSEDYVIADFDLIKKHKRIQGKFRKNILKKGKTYFGE